MTNGESMAEDVVVEERGRPKWLIPLVVVLVLGGAFGFTRWRYASSHESTDDAAVGGHLVPVLAKVGGFVSAVAVTENQHVDAGAQLVTLDTIELAQRVRQAEADVLVARSQSGSAGVGGQAQSRVQQAASQRESLGAQIQAARANLTRAEKDLDRIKGLVEKEIVPRQQLDAATAAVESARATVQSLEQQRSGAAAGVATAQGGVKEYEARLQSAEAALSAAQLQLSYARVVAPVGGTVSKRSVEPGQLLQAGQPLLTIVADTGTFVNANFKETQLADIRAGQAVDIDVDAYGKCQAKGEVAGIGGATGSQFALIPTDNATGNFTKIVQRVPVRIKLIEGCGNDRPLRPGMSVTVHVSTAGGA
jgi:membrane fusion protein (multidrug efflux system)